jgi:Holliday junction resolvase-like predicted endonuclease
VDLRTLEEVVERAVKKALAEARSEEMKAVAEALKALADYTKAGFAHLNKRVSDLEDSLGALTEATLSRYVWEDLRAEVEARGERVLSRRRNARVDGLDIDLLVETDKAVYVVEVKVRPRRRDVDTVARKAEAAAKALGKPAAAILAGARIGDDVEKHAKGKGVQIYRY